MMSSTAFAQALRDRLRGDVRCDDLSRGLFATDASLYQLMPTAVALPRDEADVLAAVATAAEFGVPILPRGGGTSLGGSCVGDGLVLDTSMHLRGLLEVNAEQRWCRVQPGLVRDNLNALLKPHGLMFAPDPATGNRACLGGLIGNNSSGMRSIVYGKTVDHLLGLRVVLADGTLLELGELSPAEYAQRAAVPGREGGLLRDFQAIVESHRDEIAARYPRIMRRVQGYNLDEFPADGPWNLGKVVCGSEGTLATILEARLNLVPVPAATALCLAHFDDLLAGLRTVPFILESSPSAVELLDHQILDLARRNATTAGLLGFVEGAPAALFAIEFFGETQAEATERARAMADSLLARGLAQACPLAATPADQARVWAVRKAGLGVLLGMRGDRKPIPIIEDAAVPVESLADYIDQVQQICARHDTPVIMYAHSSVGLLHVRPVLNIKDPADVAKMMSIADATFEQVVRFGGSWSGEHGDGLARSAWLERFFGPTLAAAFGEVKRLFDPRGLMNPGKIVNPPSPATNLRYFPGYQAAERRTSFKFRRDAGFAGAVEMCNGVGACRQTLVGTMCPSYRATLDEEHSTRGRANALRLAMTGQLEGGLTHPRVHDAFDLCLSCKACKTECPSNVDMARLKSEFLHQWHGAKGVTLRERLVGSSAALARRLAGPLAPLANAFNASAFGRGLLQRAAGFDARRTMPAYARQSFADWFIQRPNPLRRAERRVVLFDDTWLNFHEPQVGLAATELLESCGYEVVLAQAGCCQRPAISKGLLDQARSGGEATLRRLDEWLVAGTPIVCCEPSCASALVDDLPDLLDDEALGQRASAGISMIDVFLARELDAGRLDVGFSSPLSQVLLHGHCHQKALFGTAAMKSLWARVPGLTVSEVDGGCCGMAGSFGYEAEHYEVSLKIGEERLFPAVRAADEATQVIACGFSCRHQLQDGTGRRALHWVETLRGDWQG